MAKQATIGEWYCPACHGTGQRHGAAGESYQWCAMCGGRGTVGFDPDTRGTGGGGPGITGQDWVDGGRNIWTAGRWLAILLAVGFAAMVASTWVQLATPVLRPVLEVLPASLVSRDGDGGSPVVLFVLVAVVVVGAFFVVSRLRRRALSSGATGAAYGWGLLRAGVAVLGFAVAITVAGIAAGADLEDQRAAGDTLWVADSSQVPEGYDGTVHRTDRPWAFGLVLGVIGVWGMVGTWRLARRIGPVPGPEPIAPGPGPDQGQPRG